MRPQILFALFSPVTRLKGVGPNLAKAFGRLLKNDETITPLLRDLLFHLPSGIIDRRFMPTLREAPADTVATFIVRVDAHHPPSSGQFMGAGKKPYRVLCSNSTGSIELIFFSPQVEYLKQSLPVGETRVISGRVEKFDFRLQMPHPDIIAPESELPNIKRVEPLYPLTQGLTNKKIATLIDMILAQLPDLPEWITPEKRTAKGWPHWQDAITAAHFPADMADLSPDNPIRQRLAYDELLAHQLHLAGLRLRARSKTGPSIADATALRDTLTASLPFRLTQGQRDVLAEIDADLSSNKRMVRLLQGDVGSGKTLVALMAMLRAVESGYQAALMVPTEIIANQHYKTLTQFCASLPNVRIELLTGSVKGAQREAITAALADGSVSIAIGTHALFQEGVNFHKLGLIVIDEQHRFGVEQRMRLAAKGEQPHILHMSATPIPRSLTMTIYGDMDCSLLTEKPAGRQPIITRVVPLSRYEEVMDALHRALAANEKIYWICPLIEEVDGEGWMVDGEYFSPPSTIHPSPSTSKDIAAAESRATEFRARFGSVVGLVHGRMRADERDAVMHAFAGGALRILVATTVVEVGVDVRDATIMIIEQAERFGLSQLHQLRGRVGRGEKPSSCVLLYNDRAGDTARKRLMILRETEDGFRIAEADLHIRGGGELLGTRQSGLPRFRFADPLLHEQLMIEARDDIHQHLQVDPTLATPRGDALKLLSELFDF